MATMYSTMETYRVTEKHTGDRVVFQVLKFNSSLTAVSKRLKQEL